MCEEESDDHEAVAKLLEINDSIHRTIERYRLIKKGDVEGASKIPKGTLGTSGAGVTKGPNNELSLIDLGGPEDEEPSAPVASTSSVAGKSSSLENDLLGLSLGDSMGEPGPISLGGSNGVGMYIRCSIKSFANVCSGSSSASQAHQLSNAQITSLFQQSQSNPPPQLFNPTQSLFTVPSPKPPNQGVQPPPRTDPFASLTSSQTSRQASPFQYQQSIQSPSVLAAKPPQNPQPSSLISTTTDSQQDDEWTFASALPVQTPSTLTLTDSTIQIHWELSRPTNQTGIIEIKSKISNKTATPISQVTFKVAVTRVRIIFRTFKFFFSLSNRHSLSIYNRNQLLVLLLTRKTVSHKP
jgi:ADP-ribosylation factor-binding protein GGA